MKNGKIFCEFLKNIQSYQSLKKAANLAFVQSGSAESLSEAGFEPGTLCKIRTTPFSQK